MAGATYSSGSNPLAGNLLPARGRGENCGLRMRDDVALLRLPTGRVTVGEATAETTNRGRGGNGGRGLENVVLTFDFLSPLSSSLSGVRGQSTSNMPSMMM